MSKRMKGFTCCGDCIHYNYKKHKCNLGANVETDARNPFYDDCPIPDIPSEQEIRNKAIEEFIERIEERLLGVHPDELYCGYTAKGIANICMSIAEQLKEVGE